MGSEGSAVGVGSPEPVELVAVGCARSAGIEVGPSVGVSDEPQATTAKADSPMANTVIFFSIVNRYGKPGYVSFIIQYQSYPRFF